MYDPPIEEGEEMAEDFSHIHLKSNNTAENDNERYGLGKLIIFLLIAHVSLSCLLPMSAHVYRPQHSKFCEA